jgi:hypothetical protein
LNASEVVPSNEDVLRLDVAMNDAVLMRRREPIQNGKQQTDGLRRR